MTDIDEKKAVLTRRAMEAITSPEGSVRDLALRTGLSEQTIRNVASSGVLSSMHTAVALQAGTDGLISTDVHMQPGARGARVYTDFPGDAVMAIAISRRCSPGDVLASVGLTQQDLSAYVSGGSEAVRRRVRAALGHLGIATGADA